MENCSLLFDVMDIVKETKRMIDSVPDFTDGMTASEKGAYEMGVNNTLNMLYAILDSAEGFPLHYAGMDCITEYDVDDFIKMIYDDNYWMRFYEEDRNNE